LGTYGLRDLMLDLSKKYGKDQAFNDDMLFDEIAKLTYPQIREFFRRYVEGPEPLPLREVFNEVGLIYAEEEKLHDYSLGISSSEIGVTEADGKPKLQIVSTEKQNAMSKALGFKQGDIIVKLNDEPLPDLGPDLGLFLQKHYKNLPQSKTLNYTVLRKEENGETKELVLTAPVTKVEIIKHHQMHFDEFASQEKLALRNSWLKP